MAVIHCPGTIQGTKVIFEHKNDKEFDNILFQLNETCISIGLGEK